MRPWRTGAPTRSRRRSRRSRSPADRDGPPDDAVHVTVEVDQLLVGLALVALAPVDQLDPKPVDRDDAAAPVAAHRGPKLRSRSGVGVERAGVRVLVVAGADGAARGVV